MHDLLQKNPSPRTESGAILRDSSWNELPPKDCGSFESGAQCRQNRKMMAYTPPKTAKVGSAKWWERVVVQRSARAVVAEVNSALARSPFLMDEPLSSSPQPSVAMLYREEVRLGEIVGSGTYSNVYELAGLDLLEDRSNTREEPENILNKEARQTLKADAVAPNGEPKYVVKHLKPDLIQETKTFESAASDLIMEARFLSQLSHPNILSLKGVAFGGAATFACTGLYDSFFIVLDKIEETLHERLYRWRQEKISNTKNAENQISAKIEIALQIARALSYCHERRLVYRDLKPQNLGLTGDNIVKLFDFGFCRELPHKDGWNSTHHSQVPAEMISVNSEVAEDPNYDELLYGMSGKGTLMYMSPEVLGTRRYNQKADVYGWAVIFYEMLTLQKPYHILSLEAHRRSICKRNERPPLEGCGIPSSLQDLLTNCWDANTVHRFSMKEAQAHLGFIQSELAPGLLTTESLHRCLSTTRKMLSPIHDALTSFANDVQAGYESFLKDFSGHPQGGKREIVTSHTVLMGTTHTRDDLSGASSISGLSFAEEDEEDLWLAGTKYQEAVLFEDKVQTDGIDSGEERKKEVRLDRRAPKAAEEEEDPNSILEFSEPLNGQTGSLQPSASNGLAFVVQAETDALAVASRHRQAPRGYNGTLVYHRFYGQIDRNVSKAEDERNQNNVNEEPRLWASNLWTARAA